MTTVVKLVERRVWPADIVRIDRRTKWGNPFVIGRDGNRKQVIDKYAKWIASSREAGPLRAAIRRGELFDKKLACHCYPLPCHGDVLAELSMKHGRMIKEIS